MKYGYYAGVSIIFCLVIYRLFIHIGSEPLVRWDEYTNKQVVDELVESRTFPYLTYHSEPFFEKPPLWYFFTGTVVRVLGTSIFSLRFISALSGLGITIMVWKMSRQWFGKAGSIAAVFMLLTTNQLYVQNAGGYFSSHTLRSADPDSLQIFFMVLSVYCFGQINHKLRLWMLAGFGFSALAILTKGLLGLLPVAVYFIYIFVSGMPKEQNLMHRPHYLTAPFSNFIIAALSVSAFLIILAPWYAAMINTYGNLFIQEHLGYHQFERIMEPLENHGGPWWFYFQILDNKSVFIGLEMLVVSVVYLIRQKKYFIVYRTFAPIIMVLCVLFILTLTQTKLAWYILPLYPFAALIIGNAAGRVYDLLSKKSVQTRLIQQK